MVTTTLQLIIRKVSSVYQISECNFVEIFYNETMYLSLAALFQKSALRCLPISLHAYVIQYLE
jgi:hypothetical protein